MVYFSSVHVLIAQKIGVVEGVAKSWAALITFFYVEFDVPGDIHISKDVQVLASVQLEGVLVIEG